MRRLARMVSLLALCGLAPSGVSTAQTGFNGVITFKATSSSGRTDTVKQLTKDRRLRLEGFGGQGAAMIIDKGAGRMILIQPEQKQYMSMTEADAKQMQAMMGPMLERMKRQQGAPEGQLRFTKTGRTEVVAGVRCEVYRGQFDDPEKDQKQEGEACLAPGVGFALGDLMSSTSMLMGNRGPAELEQYRALVGTNQGILKAGRLENGKLRTELEAIDIAKGSVPDSMFVPPAGYTEIRLADMLMKGMKGQGAAGGRAP